MKTILAILLISAAFFARGQSTVTNDSKNVPGMKIVQAVCPRKILAADGSSAACPGYLKSIGVSTNAPFVHKCPICGKVQAFPARYPFKIK